MQFKFNLSPDWYACSSPCINGPLLGRSGGGRSNERKTNITAEWRTENWNLLSLLTNNQHVARALNRGEWRTFKGNLALINALGGKWCLKVYLHQCNFEVIYRKFWALRSWGKPWSCYFAYAVSQPKRREFLIIQMLSNSQSFKNQHLHQLLFHRNYNCSVGSLPVEQSDKTLLHLYTTSQSKELPRRCLRCHSINNYFVYTASRCRNFYSRCIYY